MSLTSYPSWASEKQLEGMRKFSAIASEYITPIITFKQHENDENKDRFTAQIEWVPINSVRPRNHEFDIDFDHEAAWDKYGDRIYEWQFLFSFGDASREMSTEVFFLEMFFEAEKELVKMEESNNV